MKLGWENPPPPPNCCCIRATDLVVRVLGVEGVPGVETGRTRGLCGVWISGGALSPVRAVCIPARILVLPMLLILRYLIRVVPLSSVVLNSIECLAKYPLNQVEWFGGRLLCEV